MRMRVFVAQYWRVAFFLLCRITYIWELNGILRLLYFASTLALWTTWREWSKNGKNGEKSRISSFQLHVFLPRLVFHGGKFNIHFDVQTHTLLAIRHDTITWIMEIFVGKRRQKERERFCDVFLSQFIIWFSCCCVSVETLTSSNFFVINVNALKIELVVPDTVTIRSGHDPSDMLIFAPD